MRAIAWIGILVFLAAWFCPVVEGQDFLKARSDKQEQAADAVKGVAKAVGKEMKLPEGPNWLPGWEACRAAWELLVEGSGSEGGDSWKDRVKGATSLTNVLMVLGLLLLLGQRSGNPLMGLLMLGAAALNASWIYFSDDPSKFMQEIKIGYWLWAGSFVLVGLGLMAGREDDGYVVAPR